MGKTTGELMMKKFYFLLTIFLIVLSTIFYVSINSNEETVMDEREASALNQVDKETKKREESEHQNLNDSPGKADKYFDLDRR